MRASGTSSSSASRSHLPGGEIKGSAAPSPVSPTAAAATSSTVSLATNPAQAQLRRTLDELIAEAVEFHACSGKRRQIHPAASKILFSKRVGSSNSTRSPTITYNWKVRFRALGATHGSVRAMQVENVSKLIEGRYVFSPSFFIDGYWMRLQAGRIRW